MTSDYTPAYSTSTREVLEALSSSPRSIQNLALNWHNTYRKDHDAPPLTLDSKLCEQAQVYAHALANGLKPTAVGESSAELGRNVHRISNSGPRCQVYSGTEAVTEAVETWYGYNTQYNWMVPIASSFLAKLFSQMVWKSTRSLGVGVATGGAEVKNMTVVVALYDPPGNVPHQNQSYKRNVSPHHSSHKENSFIFHI